MSNTSTTSTEEYPTNPEAYECIEEVARGTSGRVYTMRVTTMAEQPIVAVKVIDLEGMNVAMESVQREVAVMKLFNHENCVQCLQSFVYETELWVVMRFYGAGSCFNILKSHYKTGFDEVTCATILKEVLMGMIYLHNNDLIHRDIKAGNVLIDEDGSVAIADFGVSAALGESTNKRAQTVIGSACWMAPEIFSGEKGGYDKKVDIWSFGMTALELANGKPPLANYPAIKLARLIVNNPPPVLENPTDGRKFSDAFKNMVKKCLVKDPEERPTADKLLEQCSKFFKKAKSKEWLVENLLNSTNVATRERLTSDLSLSAPSIDLTTVTTTASSSNEPVEPTSDDFWDLDDDSTEKGTTTDDKVEGEGTKEATTEGTKEDTKEEVKEGTKEGNANNAGAILLGSNALGVEKAAMNRSTSQVHHGSKRTFIREKVSEDTSTGTSTQSNSGASGSSVASSATSTPVMGIPLTGAGTSTSTTSSPSSSSSVSSTAPLGSAALVNTEAANALTELAQQSKLVKKYVTKVKAANDGILQKNLLNQLPAESTEAIATVIALQQVVAHTVVHVEQHIELLAKKAELQAEIDLLTAGENASSSGSGGEEQQQQ